MEKKDFMKKMACVASILDWPEKIYYVQQTVSATFDKYEITFNVGDDPYITPIEGYNLLVKDIAKIREYTNQNELIEYYISELDTFLGQVDDIECKTYTKDEIKAYSAGDGTQEPYEKNFQLLKERVKALEPVFFTSKFKQDHNRGLDGIEVKIGIPSLIAQQLDPWNGDKECFAVLTVFITNVSTTATIEWGYLDNNPNVVMEVAKWLDENPLDKLFEGFENKDLDDFCDEPGKDLPF